MAVDFSSDGCVDGIELLFSNALVQNFTDAFATCQILDGILAVPSHAAKYDRLRDLIGNNPATRPFLGLFDPTNPFEKTLETDRFLTFPENA